VATYRIFPSTSGPSAATAYTGDYIAGVAWEVTTGGMWFTGYWWWCCSTGQATGPVKCALWCATGSTTGVLVPGATVTSGTLTAGAWNYIPLATPAAVAIGTPYLALVAQNGSFPDTPGSFGSGDTYGAGIVNGPLTCFSSTPDGGTGSPAPYFLHQGTFSTSQSDPAAAFPAQNNAASNLWVDVQVSTTAPAGYTGAYRLWPGKYDSSPASGLDTNLPFTLATEVRLSQACRASWLWFHSYSGSASLPTWAGVYAIAGQSLAAQNAAPSWLTPDGSGPATAGGGWCKCALNATLAPGSYKAAVYNVNGGAASWSAREYGYWLTGAGSAGITSGPVSSPANGSAATAYVYTGNPSATPPYAQGTQEPGNGTFARDDSVTSGAPQYPYLAADYTVDGPTPTGAIGESFWVDLEVTPLLQSGPLMASGIV
jgi:hypothetical protein